MTELQTFESERLSIREGKKSTIIEIFHDKEDDRSHILQFIKAVVNLLAASRTLGDLIPALRQIPEREDQTSVPTENLEADAVSEQIKHDWWVKEGEHFLRNVNRDK